MQSKLMAFLVHNLPPIQCFVKKEFLYDFEKGQVELPEMFLVADLTDKPIKTGFSWGKSGPNTKIIRPNDEPIWIIEKRVKQGFLSRLFGGNK